VLILVFNDLKLYVHWFFRFLSGTLSGKSVVKPGHEEVEPAVIELKREADF
jgi:hypothetical protein